MDTYIPRQLRELMQNRGQQGEKWLSQLPQTLDQLQHDWGLVLEPAFPNSYCNYVAPGTTLAGQGVVLKISYPDSEFERELAYLLQQQLGPVPKIIKVDETIPALLLERISPATTLATIDEDEAIRIAAGLMKRLWRTPAQPHSFSTLPKLYQNLLEFKNSPEMSQVVPAEILNQAEAAYLSLQPNSEPEVLLHGDLHQFNMIADGESEWLVIDPAGFVGEPAFEVAAFLRNPPAVGLNTQLRDVLNHRITAFAELLDLDASRIYRWGLFQTVLSTYWAAEDAADFQESFASVAKTLAELKYLS